MKGYPILRLGDVVKPVQDRMVDRRKWKFDKYVAGEHIDSGEIRIRNYGLIKGNEEVIGSAFHMRFKPGHILYSTRRAYLRKAGMVNFEGICSNVTLILQANEEKLLQSLLPFILQSEDFIQYAISRSIGSTNPFVKWTDLSRYKIRLPPLGLQKKFSRILWAFEDTMEKIRNLLRIAEKLKKGLIEELLTKGIGHKKFKNSELGKIPEEWGILRIADFCYVKGRIGWRGLRRSEFTKEGPILITGTDFVNGKIDWSTCYHITKERYFESPEIMVKDKDILVTKDGTIGKIAFVENQPYEASLNSHLLIVRPDKRVIPKYLFYFLHSGYFFDFIELQKSGSTLKGLGQKKFEKFKICIPSLAEQEIIVSKIEKANELCNRLKEHYQNTMCARKKIANSLLSGELLVQGSV